MKMKKVVTNFIIMLFLVLAPTTVLGQGKITTSSDSLTIEAMSENDTLSIRMTTNNPKVQMSFLMQGFNVYFCNEDSISCCYAIMPNAGMVRNLLSRHPNEVKASLAQGGQREIRPNLEPLITALNTVPATLIVNDCAKIDCKHYISLFKDKGLISFLVSIPCQYIDCKNDSVVIRIVSQPSDIIGNREYVGTRLSRENQMPSNGLGNAPKSPTDNNRIISIKRRIAINKNTH